MDRASQRISRCAAFVAVMRLTRTETLADHETSQQRADRMLAEWQAERSAGVPASERLSGEPGPPLRDQFA
jgi:hypothetical protein